tara:strand:- start:44 stop:580 length:537 start_codon:yes stop_codon:yes gene_type:complete
MQSEMGNNLTKEEVAKEIWGNIWVADLNKISQLIHDYVPFSDNFIHPILHENAHQSGNDPDKEGITKEMSERFKKQNELFRYLWLHPKFKFMLHNDDYRDKYGYTALERLRFEFKCYCDKHKQFVRDNICKDIELVELVESTRWYMNGEMPTFKNTEHFGKLYSKEDVIGNDTSTVTL